MHENYIDIGLAELRAPGTNRVKPLRSKLNSNIKDPQLLIEEKIGSLPNKPDSYYLIPAEILRSSLFTASGTKIAKEGSSTVLKNSKLSSQNGIDIRFSGHLLRQNELDVWIECMDLLIQKNSTNMIEFKASDFLKNINRNNTTASKNWLFKALQKLVIGEFTLISKKIKFSGQLITGYRENKDSKTVCVFFESKVATLFSANNCTKISKKQRKQMQKQPLSKWLHSYYLSHTNPYPVKIKTIIEYSGSNSQEERYFKKTLKKAIIDLALVTGWQIFIDKDNLLQCKKGKPEK